MLLRERINVRPARPSGSSPTRGSCICSMPQPASGCHKPCAPMRADMAISRPQ